MLTKNEIKNIRIDENLIVKYRFNNPSHQNRLNCRFAPIREADVDCFVFKKTLHKIGLNIDGRERIFNIDDFSENGIHTLDSVFHFYLE
jgi:hypothetical protein